MEKRKLFFFISFFWLSTPLFSQELESEKNDIIEQRVDFLLDINEGGETDFTTLFEQLETFYHKPLNLNSASKSELTELGLLNAIQINNLLQHIEKHGRLIRYEELQSIDGFSLEDIRLIQPFTKVGGSLDQARLTPKTVFKEGSSSLFIRYTRILEEQEGYREIDEGELRENPNKRYLGSPDKLFSRYRFKYSNQLSVGITAEKDAGEEFFKGSQKDGFDFYSAHFFIQNIGNLKQLAIGDFQAQFGQGLTFWSGLAFGRTPSVFTLKRNAPKLRPYTSVQEDLFLRGGGATLEVGKLQLTLFYSSKNTDANITGLDTLNDLAIISSLPEDGFHRTPRELEKKNAIMTEYLGGNVSYESRNLSIGLTAVHNEIQADLQPRRTVANQFNRLDNQNTNVGFDFSYLYKNLNLFGEVAQSFSGGRAYTTGALLIVDPRLSLGLQQRSFQHDFIPIQSNAIGESSTNSNEQGTFIGIESKLSEALSLSAYADRFVFPWLQFRADAPSEGQRLFAQLTYRPSREMETYFRYRSRQKGRNNSPENGLNEVIDETTNNYRLHFNYQLTKSLTIASRIVYTTYELQEQSRESGILIFQDLKYKKLSSPLSFALRYALFDTESFNSRIYAYENDVLYAFSIPAYNGRGARFYISSKYHLSRGIDFWLRFAQTYYTDRKFVGTGKDEIDGNVRSEIKAQLRFKF